MAGRIPFEFVIDKLERLDPSIRPMFGCHAVYISERIMIILRDRPGKVEDNGVWIATTRDHHESLKRDFPSLRSIGVFGAKVSQWQVIPADADDFEESALRLCDLILRNDRRIGKFPQR